MPGNNPPRQAVLRPNDNLRLSIHAGVGLSEASADYTGGVRLTWRFDRF